MINLDYKMTLTESGENGDDKIMPEPSTVNIGQVLVNVLNEAQAEERITYGVFESAEVLEVCPEQVMLCVLPKMSTSDVLINIQHKLIEAHCWENAVSLVKVDSSEKLVALLTSKQGDDSAAAAVDRTMDFSCLLVGFPVDAMSDNDFQITKMSYLFNEEEGDSIALPD